MSKTLAEKLLERNRVGALLRVFATTPETVEYHVTSSLKAVEKLLALRTGGKPTFARIDLLVSSDTRFDDSDCGLTASRLREEVVNLFPEAPVYVLEIKQGDIYCMLLNYGIVNQLENRIPYSFILSHGAAEYATQENVDALLGAMTDKARVAGLAITELSESVTEGRIANTCAVWHNKSLMTVGGFDLRAAKPTRELCYLTDKVTSACEVTLAKKGVGDVEYYPAGCEEIIPIIRMIRNFGPCIKVITPNNPDASWNNGQKEGIDSYYRHLAKMATKKARQEHMAKLMGGTFAEIKSGLMEASYLQTE